MNVNPKAILILLAIALLVWAFTGRGTNGTRPEWLAAALLLLAWLV